MTEYRVVLTVLTLVSLACLLCGQSDIAEAATRFGALLIGYLAFALLNYLTPESFGF
jgi:hypothetical protein